MHTTTSISATFDCTLERAFKTAMLCDLSKIHTGYGVMPKVTHVTDDEDWGQPGSSKKVHVASSLTQKGGFASVDNVLEREENQYWVIEVNQFQSWMLGFYSFIGKWETKEIEPSKIEITYSYEQHTRSVLLYPACWLFTRFFWKRYMKQVMENIRGLVEEEEPYLYS